MNSYYKCRLCLEECSRNVKIFNKDFPQMIELLTGLKVDPNDGLPESSCLQCYKEVKSAMLTRYQIINSHKILLEELNSSHYKFSSENVTNTLTYMREEVSSTSNNNFEKVINSTTENDVFQNSLIEDVGGNNAFLTTFTTDYNELRNESKKTLEEMYAKHDPESESIDTDGGKESHAENENSNDSLSSTDADKLIANAESIIKAAKSNPSKDAERTFKKLIRKLQSREGRSGKSFKRYNPYSKTRKKERKSNNKTQPKKKSSLKEEDDIYRVKVNYDVKPEYLEYLKSVGKKDRATCPICSKEMYGANLKSHLITHTYDPTPCHLCGRTSKNAQALQDHINYYHKTTPDRFICDQCGKGFRVPCFLEKHRKKEHQGPREKPFECHVCGKKFYEKMQLKNHINITHNKIKPFKCEHCGKDFGRRTQFVTHQLVHTKENRYHCQVCGKGFKIKQTMQTHLKGVHGIEEEKTIFCKICQKGFSSAQGLRAHVNSRVHGLEKCEHCSEFITLEYKNIHLKEIHGIDTKDMFS